MKTPFPYLAQAIQSLQTKPPEKPEGAIWEMIELNTVAEVNDCADLIANLCNTIVEQDSLAPDEEQTKFAISLFTELSNLICYKPELERGLNSDHVKAFSNLLFKAEEYSEAFDLLSFIVDHDHLQDGMNAGQASDLAKYYFETQDEYSPEDDDEDEDDFDFPDMDENLNEEFLSVMNLITRNPEWSKEIPPEVGMAETDLVQCQFDNAIGKKDWNYVVDQIDYYRHRSSLIDPYVTYHLPDVIRGLLAACDHEASLRMIALFEVMTELPMLDQYISQDQQNLMKSAILFCAEKNIKEGEFENYRQQLCAANNLPIQKDLESYKLVFELANSLNAKFMLDAEQEECRTFILDLKVQHPKVFKGLSAFARGTASIPAGAIRPSNPLEPLS